MSIVIFDVDNCLSDDTWRLQFIRDGADRFSLYHMLSAFDSVGNMATLTQYLPHDVILFTAMPEKYRQIRKIWLARNNIKYRAMYMRADDDYRPSPVVKQEMLDRLMADYDLTSEDITAAYDDHIGVVDMYIANGVRGLQLLINNQERNKLP